MSIPDFSNTGVVRNPGLIQTASNTYFVFPCWNWSLIEDSQMCLWTTNLWRLSWSNVSACIPVCLSVRPPVCLSPCCHMLFPENTMTCQVLRGQCNVGAIWQVVWEIMVGNYSTNQRSVFGSNSLNEVTVPIGKQPVLRYNVCNHLINQKSTFCGNRWNVMSQYSSWKVT